MSCNVSHMFHLQWYSHNDHLAMIHLQWNFTMNRNNHHIIEHDYFMKCYKIMILLVRTV